MKLWLTFNEPFVFTWVGYGLGAHAPLGSGNQADGQYRTGHTVLKAHAEAWHLYNDNYRATQGGTYSVHVTSTWQSYCYMITSLFISL